MRLLLGIAIGGGLMVAVAPAAAQPAEQTAEKACVPANLRNLPMSRVPAGQRHAVMACLLGYSARELNAQTPIRMGEDVLESVIASGTTLQYNMRLNVTAEEFPAAERQRLAERTRSNVCSAPDMRQTVILGGAFVYSWFDRNSRLLHQLRIDRC
jgi:hypothetical protein